MLSTRVETKMGSAECVDNVSDMFVYPSGGNARVHTYRVELQ